MNTVCYLAHGVLQVICQSHYDEAAQMLVMTFM